MKKIILTEEQVNQLVLIESTKVISSFLKEAKEYNEIKEKIKQLLTRGVAVASIVVALASSLNMNNNEATSLVDEVKNEMLETPNDNEWTLIANDVLATVYNAEPRQCNADVTHTASMFRLNLSNVLSHRIIAMERTMMKEFGLKYGDVVKVEGTGKWDGEWQIQDTMNKRFAGQHKIDILIPKSEGLGKWKNVKVYKLTDSADAEKYKSQMAPQLSKSAAQKQIAKMNKNTTV